jgi:hypothetical protein
LSKFAGPHNVPNKGKIPRVLHLFWMSQRAYHGDKVVMMVFTENVPDGSAVELRISPAGKKDVIDTITGLKTAAMQLVHTYTIDWKGKLPAGTGQRFVFRAVIGKLSSDESPVLLVDVEPPVLSA